VASVITRYQILLSLIFIFMNNWFLRSSGLKVGPGRQCRRPDV